MALERFLGRPGSQGRGSRMRPRTREQKWTRHPGAAAQKERKANRHLLPQGGRAISSRALHLKHVPPFGSFFCQVASPVVHRSSTGSTQIVLRKIPGSTQVFKSTSGTLLTSGPNSGKKGKSYPEAFLRTTRENACPIVGPVALPDFGSHAAQTGGIL